MATRGIRRGLIAIIVLAVVTAGVVTVWNLTRSHVSAAPGCLVTAPSSTAPGSVATFTFTPEQAGNAATIAGVGTRLGMPDHAVTVALATALQESKLRNLPGGDRDSLGLFQQRPSQGWGTTQQILDPIYAATAFYTSLAARPNWQTLSVTEAAQQVQRSAAPDAYAQWEDTARAAAAALTGQSPAALSCHDLGASPPTADLIDTANAELGTAVLSGAHPTARGWAISSWLVAHATGLGIDQVTFDGQTWTMASGTWSSAGTSNGILSLHRATVPTSSG